MMRKTIVRTMSTSTIKGYLLELVEGQPKAIEIEPLTVIGNATENDALKVLKEKYGNKAVTISEIAVERDTYEISVEDFLKYAKKVEKNSEIEENEKENE